MKRKLKTTSGTDTLWKESYKQPLVLIHYEKKVKNNFWYWLIMKRKLKTTSGTDSLWKESLLTASDTDSLW